MPRYQAKALRAPISTSLTGVAAIWASSGTRARRFAIYDTVLSATGGLSSTDCQIEYDFSRFTTTSLIAGTSFTPSPVDTADDASLAVMLNNVSTEPAALAAAGAGLNLYTLAENQRATFRWRALETYDMLMVPATNLSGIEIRALSSNFNSSMVGALTYIE